MISRENTAKPGSLSTRTHTTGCHHWSTVSPYPIHRVPPHTAPAARGQGAATTQLSQGPGRVHQASLRYSGTPKIALFVKKNTKNDTFWPFSQKRFQTPYWAKGGCRNGTTALCLKTVKISGFCTFSLSERRGLCTTVLSTGPVLVQWCQKFQNWLKPLSKPRGKCEND